MGLTKRVGFVAASVGSSSGSGISGSNGFSVLGRKRLGLTKRVNFVVDSTGSSWGSSVVGRKRLGLAKRLGLVDDSTGSVNSGSVRTALDSVVDSMPANSFHRRGRGLLNDGTRVGNLPRFVLGFEVVLVVVVVVPSVIGFSSSADGRGCFCWALCLAFSFMAAIRSL